MSKPSVKDPREKPREKPREGGSAVATPEAPLAEEETPPGTITRIDH